MKRIAFLTGSLVLGAAVIWAAVSSSTVLSKVQLEGQIHQMSDLAIQEVVKPYMGQSFWRVDLERLHADLVRLEWVYQAQVTRRWPNQLKIRLVEQTPVVRWQEEGLLNQAGEIFYPHQIEPFQHLVKVAGNPLNAANILQALAQFQQQFDQMEWPIETLTQHPDRSWQIRFLSGVQLLVDDPHQQAKLARFIRAYPKTDPALRKFAQVYDLRYSNGFVIKRSSQTPDTRVQATPNSIE